MNLYHLLIIMLRILNELVQSHGDKAEYNNTCDDKMKLKHLTSINNQVSEAIAGGKKFSYDDTYERKTDIDLHGA